MKASNVLLVLTGPSGVGKSSIIKALLKVDAGVMFSISHTTREPRVDERKGEDYYFVTEEAFLKTRALDGFLEHAEVHGHFYGTSLAELERARLAGKDLLLDIDIQGADQVARRIPDAPTVFVLPPDFGTLERRLRGRGSEAGTEITRRLRTASEEVRRYTSFEYVVVNEKVDSAVIDLKCILDAERLKRERQVTLAEKVIGTFPGPGNPPAGGGPA